MLRILVMVLLVIFNFILQSTCVRAFALASIVPNLLIIITVSLGFMRGKKTGMLVGFLCGLLIDLFYGEVIGFYAIIYMYIGYGNGIFNKIFYYEDITLPIALCAGSDLLYNFTVYVFRFVLRNRLDLGMYLVKVMLPEMVYTVVVMVFVYRILTTINKQLDKLDRRRAKVDD